VSLASAFIARYSEQRVLNLTQADAAGETAYSSTKLATACTDAEGEFVTLVGVDFDDTDNRHLRVAVQLVEAILLEYGAASQEEADRARTRAEKAAVALRKTTSRSRMLPETDSPFTPTTTPSGTRPRVDREDFGTSIPNPPTGTSGSPWLPGSP